MILIALLIVFGLVGVFAMENSGTQDFNFLGAVWHEPVWVPAAIGVALVSALLLLYTSTLDIGHRFLRYGHRREVEGHRDVIDELRDENIRLREELAAARGRAVAPRPRQTSWVGDLRSLPGRLARR